MPTTTQKNTKITSRSSSLLFVRKNLSMYQIPIYSIFLTHQSIVITSFYQYSIFKYSYQKSISDGSKTMGNNHRRSFRVFHQSIQRFLNTHQRYETFSVFFPYPLTCTKDSLSASNAEVASSNNNNRGSFKMALAMAIRCF